MAFITIKIFDRTLIVYDQSQTTETMGIKGLCQFLRGKHPDTYERIHITEYAYQKVAIDTSVYLYKFRGRRGEAWLGSFINLVACLRRNQIHCVFVYDTGAVPEKQHTKDERASTRAKTKDTMDAIEDALNEHKTTGVISEEMASLHQQIKGKHTTPARLLGPPPPAHPRDISRDLEQELFKLQNMFPRSEDFALTKELFDILKVPWVDAPMEAETTCSDFCRRGIVKAVLSEDSDVIAYGSPVLLPGLDIASGECDRVAYDNVLESLNMTPEMFTDFCIMCGTDYNTNIKGVGPVEACKLITAHGSIDTIGEKTARDISILNHVRGRELFTEYEQPDVTIPYCAQPDFRKLKQFMDHHNIPMSMATLKESFAHKKIVFDVE